MPLKAIYEAILGDPENAWAKEKGWEPVYRAHPVAKILLVGQAPGLRAQTSGLPFDDLSGDNLRRWMDVTRETFYDETKMAFLPMDFFFPGTKVRGDMPPRKGFAKLWHPPLLAEMPHIQLTILIGQYAHGYYLGKSRKKTLTDTVRNYQEYLPEYMPLVHPSPRNNIWHLKNPWFVEEVVPELQKLVKNALK